MSGTAPDTSAEETGADPAELLSQWLSFYGPVSPSFVGKALGLTEERLEHLLAELDGEGRVVAGRLMEGSVSIELCDRENMERLLRMLRRSRRAVFRALPPDRLGLFLAAWQGLASRGSRIEDMRNRLEALFGLPAPAAAWSNSAICARPLLIEP